ncbi:GNAT family N-acetyltransferase [Aquimarina agarilytica]|uniref:GNAT family N-acetyltransferase n=1 Tax=Aquimarina agarilytica TaxID=1087449 RepID=UPI0002884DC0|nr:GNAT family N-acetyltransferase [Aquimarina agarilytica]
MSSKTPNVRLLAITDIDKMIPLALQLGDYNEEQIRTYINEMFAYGNYVCFGFFVSNELIGLTSGWTTTRFYCGKQLEIDNVVIDAKHQSKGYGRIFESEIKAWCFERGYDTIELNSYVFNSRSHKFYFNQDYKIIGYHFQKKL